MTQVRLFFRTFRKAPVHSLAIGLALACGIGLSVAIFGLVEAILMQPFSFPRLDTVVTIYEAVTSARADWYPTSPANFLDWQQSATSFSAIAAYRRWSASLTTAAGGEPLTAYSVSPSFFSLTEVPPLMGTTFSDREAPDPSHIVVSYRFWTNRLGGDPNVVGRILTINQSPYVVVAVMPASFDFPIATEAWAPLVFSVAEKANRTERNLGVLARLKPNVSVNQAQQEMSAVAVQLGRQYPAENASRSAQVILLRQSVDRYANKFLIILMVAVVVLLLLACANVANLQLARGALRRKEVAVKIALGADRRRVIADVVAENLLFSFLGAGIGLPIAYATLAVIKANITGAVVRNVAGIMNAEISLPVLLFGCLLVVLSAILVAVPTVMQACDVNLSDVLNSEGRGSSGVVRRGMRSMLIGSQVMLATFLLITAAVLVDSFINLARAPLGYDPRDLAVYHTALSTRDYRDNSQIVNFYAEAAQKIREIPGITSVSVVSDLPSLDDSDAINLFRAGEVDLTRPFPAELRIIGPDYFRTLAIPVNHGREFLESDTTQSQQVAIISGATARKLWPGQDPLGRRLILGSGNDSAVVVGVVGEVNHFLLDRDTRATIYRPATQVAERSMYIVFRSQQPWESVFGRARSAINSIDGNDRVYKIDTLEGILSDLSGGVRVVAILLLAVGIVALILAFAGVYSVLSYLVTVQARDIAIRMSLGATPRRVIGMYLAFLAKVAVPSLTLGAIAGFAFIRVLSRVVSAVGVTFWTIPLVVMLVFIASTIATLLPGRRIAMIAPAAAARIP